MRRFLALSLLFMGCGEGSGVGDDPNPVEAGTEQSLVYGADDRVEGYQAADAVQRTVAGGTVALVSRQQLTANAGGYALNVRTTFATAYGVCADEPFRTQPVAANCTGFQVGPDLIATAGHCVDASSCGSTAMVFGYAYTAPGTLRSQFAGADVYFCAQVVGRSYTSTLDYAIIRTDRAIVGRQPLAVRSAGAPAVGQAIGVVGHPVGLPLKIAGGATVRAAASADYFEANVDTYGGNSGSPVYDAATGTIEGILVRGNNDFNWDSARRCYVSNRCADGGCPGWEDVTRSTRFAGLLNGAPPPPPPPACLARGAACNSSASCCSANCSRRTRTCR